MLTQAQINVRHKALQVDADAAYDDLVGRKITQAKFDQVLDACEKETVKLKTAEQALHKSMRYSDMGDSAESHLYPSNPGGFQAVSPNDVKFKGLLDSNGKNPFAPSPLHATQEEWGALFEAAEHQLPSYAIQMKAFRAGDDSGNRFGGRARSKAPLFTTEGAASSLLPPQLIPSAFPLLREPTRIWSHLPGMPMNSQSIQFLQHASDINPSAVTAEIAALPDEGMVFTPKTAVAQKIGSTAAFSRELLDDFGDFMGAVPAEMVKSMIDAESQFVLNNATYGILATSGILTRSATASATPIDAILAGINDIRVASASFAEADLIITHPTTALDLRTTRTTIGSYVLDQWRPMETLGENLPSFFGVPWIQTTTCPVGVAIVMSREDAIIAFTRMGPEMAVNWMSDAVFPTFSYQWRVAERIVPAVIRPTAICVISALPSYPAGNS
jgi:HK97 family phage major capsid protein